MHLLAITDLRCPASTRYRVTQFENYLQSKGARLETLPWPNDWRTNRAAQTKLLGAVAQADVVLIQRYLPDSAAIRAIRQRAGRLVYDFDDAVIYYESTRRKSRRRLARSWRFRQMVRCCDAVTAGNEYLAALGRRHAPEGRVHVLPTALELKRYECPNDLSPNGSGPSAATAAPPIIGWIGSRSTLPYLERLRHPLERLSKEIPGLTVHVIADERPDLGSTQVEWVRWSNDTEVREVKRLRAGLAPLPDDSWTRGKCGLRLLQYLAAGVPAVASPVGTQAQVTESGAALPARSDSDWVEALHRVLRDEALSGELAQRGRTLLHERFDVPVLAESIYSIWCGNN